MACDVSEMKPFQNLHFLFLFLLSAVADPKTTTKPITVKKNPPLKFGVNKNRRKQISTSQEKICRFHIYSSNLPATIILSSCDLYELCREKMIHQSVKAVDSTYTEKATDVLSFQSPPIFRRFRVTRVSIKDSFRR